MYNFIKRTIKTVVENVVSGGKKTATVSEKLLEKYKLVRRIILAVLLIWLSILLRIVIHIVMNTETHDIGPNFANVLIAYFTFAGAFFSFYTANRTSEIKEREYINAKFNNNSYNTDDDMSEWEDI